jgi:hypothetical protein
MRHEIAAEDRDTLASITRLTAGVTPLRFIQVGDYTTFLAEYTMDGDDYVVHFFPTEEHKDVAYWRNAFPSVLDEVAQAHFQAKPPKLRAAFTEEMNSWWLRADDYGHVVDKDKFIHRFLDRLDQALDRAIST